MSHDNPAPADITGLRPRIDLSPAQIDRIWRHIDGLTAENERLNRELAAATDWIAEICDPFEPLLAEQLRLKGKP